MKLLKINILFLFFCLFSITVFAQKKYKRTGICSYYGQNAVGSHTASGERIHHKSKTAAHKTLPFGTILKVTNLENNKETTVRVNDRGPYGRGRILDVTYPAAVELGLISSGTAKIKIEVIGYDSRTTEEIIQHETDSLIHVHADEAAIIADTSIQNQLNYLLDPKHTPPQEGYGIQVGIYKDRTNALLAFGKLKKAGFEQVYIESPMLDNMRLFRIIVGKYNNRNDAEVDITKLKKAGFETYFKHYN